MRRQQQPLTRDQMRSLDRKAIEEVGIPAAALMENAGRAVADEAQKMAPGGPIAIVCGRGSNGGDGYVAARHLHNRGIPVRVVGLEADRLAGDALANYAALRVCRMALHALTPGDLPGIRLALAGSRLIVDALFGTGLAGPLRDPWPALIEMLNGLGVPILAVDIPSGLDCDTGQPLGAAIRAARTVSMHAPKVGFARGRGAEFTGEIVVADIGIPRDLAGSQPGGGSPPVR